MTKKANETVAEICLYGTRRVGFGWLATTREGARLGDAELRDRSMTETVFEAIDAVAKSRGALDGVAIVFAPGGETCAEFSVASPATVGCTPFVPAPVFTISAEALVAAAQEAAR